MHIRSGLMLPLAIGLAALQGCSTMDPNSQPAAQAAVSTPVVVSAKKEAAAPAPATPMAPVVSVVPVTPVKDDKTEANKSAAGLIDRYTVMPGDTLALIAAKQEIYGDARLWPLLHRANANQVGPDGLIFPQQILAVNRNYTQDEVKALTNTTRKPAAPTPVAAKIAPEKTATSTPARRAQQVTAPAKPLSQETLGISGQAIKLSDYLRGAREAFATGDSPWAIYYYSIYLQQKVSDIDVWGELGNVYYLEGKYAEAAKAYFNVANLLIDRGQTARALELMPVIEEGDAGLSAAIYQRLTTVKQ